MTKLTKSFKDKWLKKLTDGSNQRKRYGLASDNDAERCVIGVARTVAEEMNILKPRPVVNHHYLDDEELSAIGLNKETQFYLASLNDTYIAKDGQYPKRVLKAIQALPVIQDRREPLLIESQ